MFTFVRSLAAPIFKSEFKLWNYMYVLRTNHQVVVTQFLTNSTADKPKNDLKRAFECDVQNYSTTAQRGSICPNTSIVEKYSYEDGGESKEEEEEQDERMFWKELLKMNERFVNDAVWQADERMNEDRTENELEEIQEKRRRLKKKYIEERRVLFENSFKNR